MSADRTRTRAAAFAVGRPRTPAAPDRAARPADARPAPAAPARAPRHLDAAEPAAPGAGFTLIGHHPAPARHAALDASSSAALRAATVGLHATPAPPTVARPSPAPPAGARPSPAPPAFARPIPTPPAFARPSPAPPAVARPCPAAAAPAFRVTPIGRAAATAARRITLAMGSAAPGRDVDDALAHGAALALVDPSPSSTIELHTDQLAALELDPAAPSPSSTIELSADQIAALIAEAAAHDDDARPAACNAAAPTPLTIAAPTALAVAAPATAAAAAAPAAVATRSRRIAAGTTAPADLAPIGWSDRAPPAAPPRDRSPTWHLPRGPQVGLVLFFLIASVLCGLLAPLCWGVASSELAGMRRGEVAARHRGLITLALLWGVLATCLLIVALCFALWLLARTSAHGA